MQQRIEAFDPDWVLVSDDKGRVLLRCAVASGRRTLMILQTAVHLPFGPLACQRGPGAGAPHAAGRRPGRDQRLPEEPT